MDDFDTAIASGLVSVRADTNGFSRDVEAMRGELEGVLGSGAERAALRLEAGLAAVTPVLRVLLRQILAGK